MNNDKYCKYASEHPATSVPRELNVRNVNGAAWPKV